MSTTATKRLATLEQVKAGPVAIAPDDVVLIVTGEHAPYGYWRPNGCGYTGSAEEAGRYTFAEAWSRTAHCGPEKRIEYHVPPPESSPPLGYMVVQMHGTHSDAWLFGRRAAAEWHAEQVDGYLCRIEREPAPAAAEPVLPDLDPGQQGVS